MVALLTEILYLRRLRLWGDLVTKLGSGNVFLSLALRDVVEDKLTKDGSVRRSNFRVWTKSRVYNYCLSCERSTGSNHIIPPELDETNITPLGTAGQVSETATRRLLNNIMIPWQARVFHCERENPSNLNLRLRRSSNIKLPLLGSQGREGYLRDSPTKDYACRFVPADPYLLRRVNTSHGTVPATSTIIEGGPLKFLRKLQVVA